MSQTARKKGIPFVQPLDTTPPLVSLSKTRFRCAVLLMLSLLVMGCARAQTHAADTAGPIHQSEYLAIEGATLFLLTRGEDRRAPVLLWLHGGPGGAERPLFRYFNSELEQHFVVAYWDQRGAGRSFDSDADPHQLTVARHLTDLDAVVDHLRHTLGQDRILLVGHSWGSVLGMLYTQRHPEKISAYVGVAQIVSWLKTQHTAYEFASLAATAQQDAAVLTQLRTLGPPPYSTSDQQMAMESVIDTYRGVFHKPPCKLCVIMKAMATGLVTPWEFISIHRGIHASMDAMTPELLTLDLEREVPQVEVPVLFLLGRHDRLTESLVAAGYFERLSAPCKQLVWFEDAAHNIPFEEPESFHRAVMEAALPPTTGLCSK
ncbi:MAG: alpha/beta hydrolase [Nitrospira sp.]